MSIVTNAAFFITGFLLGIGVTLLYIQYSMYSQVGEIEKQMEAMADIQEGLDITDGKEEKEDPREE